jgi:hypothetical protein
MSDANFDIIFLGQLQAGHTLAEVKPRLMQLFKVDAAKIDAIFSATAVPLKRNLDRAGAKKYQAVLARAGVKVQIRPSNTSAAAAKPAAEEVRNARLVAQAKRRAELTATVTANKPLSMSERLASAESQPAALVQAIKKENPTAAKGYAVAGNDLTMAALGADVLTLSERHQVTPVSVDISAISLRQGGDLLDASEKAEEVNADLELGQYELAATGQDLLQDHEKRVVEAVEVDTSRLLLNDVGADMIGLDEKVQVEAVSVDISGIDLAPAGSDMGQLKDERPALKPDISKISLAP